MKGATMTRQFLVSLVVTFVLLMALGFFVHGFLLNEDYAELSELFRPHKDYQDHFQYMILAQLMTAFALVWIYRKGRENKQFLAQGIRYGFAVAVLTVIPKFLIYYSIQPIPGDLVLKQILFDTIGMIVIGIVIARLGN
jgi:hypothetical protein